MGVVRQWTDVCYVAANFAIIHKGLLIGLLAFVYVVCVLASTCEML